MNIECCVEANERLVRFLRDRDAPVRTGNGRGVAGPRLIYPHTTRLGLP